MKTPLMLAAALVALAFVPLAAAQGPACLPYNPNAATNACAEAEVGPRSVTYFTPTTYGQWICVISYYCVPYVGWDYHTLTVKFFPRAYGYVEATWLCTVMDPCRFTYDTDAPLTIEILA